MEIGAWRAVRAASRDARLEQDRDRRDGKPGNQHPDRQSGAGTRIRRGGRLGHGLCEPALRREGGTQ